MIFLFRKNLSLNNAPYLPQFADPEDIIISTPCSRAGRTAPKVSLHAFTEPGQLTMRVSPLMPAASLERHPFGVIFIDSALMASGIPGVSFSMTSFVASGVTSLFAKPVPPVVTQS